MIRQKLSENNAYLGKGLIYLPHPDITPAPIAVNVWPPREWAGVELWFVPGCGPRRHLQLHPLHLRQSPVLGVGDEETPPKRRRISPASPFPGCRAECR